MTQTKFKSSIQQLERDITGTGVTLTLFVFGGALLCIPFFGFLPLIAACLGLVSVLATTKLIEERTADLKKKYDEYNAD